MCKFQRLIAVARSGPCYNLAMLPTSFDFPPQFQLSKRRIENYLNRVDSDIPLSPALSPHAGKGSQTRLPSPSLRAGGDLGWGKVTVKTASDRLRHYLVPLALLPG